VIEITLPQSAAERAAFILGCSGEITCTIMKRLGHLLIASLSALLALTVTFYLGSLFLLLFDSNYHDGFAAAGGLIIGLIVGTVVFKALFKRLSME
jgi:membrane associated rhomboid family serine protease